MKIYIAKKQTQQIIEIIIIVILYQEMIKPKNLI